MDSKLLPFWNSHQERCGYVDLNNNVFELPNIHEDKKNGFELAEIPPEAVALWHTHPSGCPNLSIEDFPLLIVCLTYCISLSASVKSLTISWTLTVRY